MKASLSVKFVVPVLVLTVVGMRVVDPSSFSGEFFLL